MQCAALENCRHTLNEGHIDMSTYGGYVDRLSRKVAARLTDIEAVFNFELGQEYELAMCLLLEDILPARFGVCRGFVVAEDGEKAGDDLVIYDRMSCPTLRSNQGRQYAAKEQIPIDAVYAYIECKHSVKTSDVFENAVSQARAVKELMLKRPARANPDYEVDGPMYNGKPRDWPRCFPQKKNQPFCAVFSREFSPPAFGDVQRDCLTPDLLILGQDHLATQSAVLNQDGIKGALFFDDKHDAGVRLETLKGQAYGVGIVTLMQALGWIELVPMDWSKTLNMAHWSALIADPQSKR